MNGAARIVPIREGDHFFDGVKMGYDGIKGELTLYIVKCGLDFLIGFS